MASPSYLVTMKCERCGKDFDVKYCVTVERKRNKTPMLCKDCMKIYKSEHMVDICASMDKQTKEQIRLNKSISTKKYWDNISDEDYDKRSKAQTRYYKSLSEDELNHKMISIRAGNRRFWDSKTKEERREYMEKAKDALFEKLKNDPVFRSAQISRASAMMKELWAKLPEEERKRRSERSSKVSKRYWANMTDEERKAISKAGSERYKNLSDDDKKIIANRMQQVASNYWGSMSVDEFAEKIDRLTKNKRPSSHERKFMEIFNNSDLVNMYELRCGVMQKNVWAHKWDFGIALDGNIILVIDIDGAFNHADTWDYDGKHSSEHIDESRYKSIPSGLKFVVIPENHLDKSVDIIHSVISMTIEEFYDSQYRFVLENKFPYPNYENSVLLNSWSFLYKFNTKKYRITTRNRIGDILITHFHPSLWMCHAADKVSPYDAWNNKELMHKLILDNTIYVNQLNYNKIVQGFNITNDAPKISYVSAGVIKILMNRYVQSFASVFDPICGFGSVLLGAVSLDKYYIGIDIRDRYIEENKQMIEFLSISTQARVFSYYNSIRPLLWSVMVTCIDMDYVKLINQSFTSIDECIDFFMNIYDLQTYMFIVPNTEKYKDFVVDKVIERYRFVNDKEWDVILINK